MFYKQILIGKQKRVFAQEKLNASGIGYLLPKESISSTLDLFKLSNVSGFAVDDLTLKIIKDFLVPKIDLSKLLDFSLNNKGHQLISIDSPEVWAFGVTYLDSMRERQSESGTPDVYAQVYNSDRPEAFFKATKNRIQSNLDDVGIRGDSTWDVPEPELAFMIINKKIVAYTIGNDMSSRSIEGANPLYLPQAKVYNKSLSIGPCLVPAENIKDPQNLGVSLKIFRSDNIVFEGNTNTSRMKRNCEYLAEWLQRHNYVPDGTLVLTGTGIIPPTEFSLKELDRIEIWIDDIGTLSNIVVKV